MRRIALGLLLAACMAIMGAQSAAGAIQRPPTEQPRASLPDVEDEVMCPICGTALNLSGAPQADRERAFIRRQIARGRTKDEIKQALVREYGSEVLATPQGEGFDLAAWIVPGALIVLVGIALIFGVLRWRRSGAEAARRPEPEPLGADDIERLRADLDRYDL